MTFWQFLSGMWKNHGTKVLGWAIGALSLLATGSLVLPPPLNKYSAAITSWAAFINVFLGAGVVGRGYGNSSKAQDIPPPEPPKP